MLESVESYVLYCNNLIYNNVLLDISGIKTVTQTYKENEHTVHTASATKLYTGHLYV